ncbi:CsgG/HfaB family protein [Actimicrobium antarcticum]|uniref:Peptidoglycan-binding protein n=1 Tax=Actimicrobium antarcticum TaxID=1051899 RepID=A0ABP7TZ79_9BURK
MNYLFAGVALASLTLTGCAGTMPTIGDTSAKTVATGSTSGASSQGANTALEHCSKSIGTLSILEDEHQPWFYQFRQQYQLQSTIPLLRMLVQQSNCFVVVERGKAMASMQNERALAASGELRSTSKMGKGQMVAADYTITPSITFSEKGTGGLGALAGGLLGSVGAIVGGSMKSNEASTTLLMTDNRSGVQLAAAEGSAKNWDFGVVGGVLGGLGGAGASGFSNTPQGKVLAAAFMDSYNQLVKATRNYSAQSVSGGLGNGGNLPVGQ